MADSPQDPVKNWEKILSTPVFPEAAEEVEKTRFRLLVISGFTLAIGLFDLSIDSNSTILGLHIKNLTDDVIRIGLFTINAYLLFHFAWNARDGWAEWRLRQTGYKEVYGSRNPPPPGHDTGGADTRQVTLYSWWASQARYIGDIGGTTKLLKAAIATMSEEVRRLRESADDNPDMPQLSSKLEEARYACARLDDQMQRIQSVTSAAQVPAALKKFDRLFRSFVFSQNQRWFVFDLALPAIAGLAGLTAISKSWWLPLVKTVVARVT